MKSPLIIDIKGNSLDDGPGIRSTIFFKGCPLNCVWCHNPESKKVTPELFWDSERCVGCGTCINLCPENAISLDNPFHVDRDRCTLCFKCLEQCPGQALTRVGREMTVDEIVNKIVPYKSFFDTSGGGVTLSGGEPTINMRFASAVLKKLKSEGIHTLVETCGWFDMEHFRNLMLPYVDVIYMDVKLIDPTEHKKYCGKSNERILSNLLHLYEEAGAGSFELLPRVPLIPEITDKEVQIQGLAEFFSKHHISSVALLPNNPIWIDKCSKLGQEIPFDRSKPIGSFYDQTRKDKVREQFSRYGITVILG